jgi:murein L,D-transpeptidase YcbB/YkuD
MAHSIVVALAASLFAALPGPSAWAQERDLREVLRARIETAGIPLNLTARGALIRAIVTLPAFYEYRAYEPAWVDRSGPRSVARELLEALVEASHAGLRSEDYHSREIESAIVELEDARTHGRIPATGALVDLELLLTDAFLVLGSHLAAGRVDPETLDPQWVAARRRADMVSVLESATESTSVGAALLSLEPQSPGYRRLKASLARYRALSAGGGWAPLPGGASLSRGDRDPRVADLRARLAAEGDLRSGAHELPNPTDSPASHVFDAEVERALLKFQRRNGLAPDGRLGPSTLQALNVSAEDRVRQIELNLERWRWLPDSLGRRFVIVNAADFVLDVVEDGDTVLSMRAIVGRRYRKTPVFSDELSYLVLSPFWHVPRSLAIQDQIPLIRRDPGYFQRVGMRVLAGQAGDAREIDPATVDWNAVTARNFPYRLRQDPGPQNALGMVKFMFPNRFNVYLHDTPSRELFSRDRRDFSSGCIRLEAPLDLAVYLLRADPTWSRERIERDARGGVERTVQLPDRVPIHILYWTAWVTPSGEVYFREDIYDRDGPLAVALREPATREDR